MGTPTLIMAPFKGLTTKAFRNAHARHFGGFDVFMAPFVSGLGHHQVSPARLSDLTPIEDNLCPTIPQIISTQAEEIILFGKSLKDHGYTHLNWNLGCPFPKIANKKKGCGLLPYPAEIDRILFRVFSELPVDFSVKTRLGYAHAGEILQVLPVLNRYPIREITIHPRIGTQVYKGEVNLEGFTACLEATHHPLIYNGDVYNLAEFKRLSRLFPSIDKWMLGRGVLMNPFLAREIKGNHIPDRIKREKMREFHQELLAVTTIKPSDGKNRLGLIKNTWYYMAACFAHGEEVFSMIKTSRSLDAYEKMLPDILDRPFASGDQTAWYFKNAIRHIGKTPAAGVSPAQRK